MWGSVASPPARKGESLSESRKENRSEKRFWFKQTNQIYLSKTLTLLEHWGELTAAQEEFTAVVECRWREPVGTWEQNRWSEGQARWQWFQDGGAQWLCPPHGCREDGETERQTAEQNTGNELVETGARVFRVKSAVSQVVPILERE